MRHRIPFSAPGWALALLLAAALPALWFTLPAALPRALLCAADLCALALALWCLRRLRAVETLVDHADCIPPPKRGLPLIARLNLALDESSAVGRQRYTAVIADTQAEMGALQSQINPHFLYNTLDAIRGQALMDGSEVIADMTEALSVLFRYSISREGGMATLQEELRSVEKYLMIQQFRFNHKLTFVREVDDTLLGCLIPRLSLQPIVENAVFHGLETREERGEIRLQLTRTGGCLVVRVRDNGVGMSAEQVVALNAKLRTRADDTLPAPDGKHSGIALTNVNRRIWLTFGEAYGVHIFSTPGVGTDVELLLPCITSVDQLGSISEAPS